MSTKVWLRRAYEPASRNDGRRVLVDRLWPRGVSRDDARIDEWLRDLAPSTRLRRWFDHDPGRWEEFRRRYRDELSRAGADLETLRKLTERGRVTLVYGARDKRRNNAVVLREIIEER